MSKFPRSGVRSDAKSPHVHRWLQQGPVALVILVAAHLVVLVGILWRILVEKGHNPLISALLVGALMLSVVASAVRVIESKRQG